MLSRGRILIPFLLSCYRIGEEEERTRRCNKEEGKRGFKFGTHPNSIMMTHFGTELSFVRGDYTFKTKLGPGAGFREELQGDEDRITSTPKSGSVEQGRR